MKMELMRTLALGKLNKEVQTRSDDGASTKRAVDELRTAQGELRMELEALRHELTVGLAALWAEVLELRHAEPASREEQEELSEVSDDGDRQLADGSASFRSVATPVGPRRGGTPGEAAAFPAELSFGEADCWSSGPGRRREPRAGPPAALAPPRRAGQCGSRAAATAQSPADERDDARSPRLGRREESAPSLELLDSQSGRSSPQASGAEAEGLAGRGSDARLGFSALQELHHTGYGVTCMAFGPEGYHRSYILLAAGLKSGTAVVYRCYRTEEELALLDDQDFHAAGTTRNSPPSPSDHCIERKGRLLGHSRTITSVLFSRLGDQLFTTSKDMTARIWRVKTLEQIQVFVDSHPVAAAHPLPLNPDVFMTANEHSCGRLKLVHTADAKVLQELAVDAEIHCLRFDGSEAFALAGTKTGGIHVLECATSCMEHRFKAQIAQGAITHIHCAPGGGGQPAFLLVNVADTSVTVVDMTYAPAGALTSLAVRHCLRLEYSPLPLKCTYSPFGKGHLIVGSGGEVRIVPLGEGQDGKTQRLSNHQTDVVVVAVNHQDTLLASADCGGKIVFWRRADLLSPPC